MLNIRKRLWTWFKQPGWDSSWFH